VLHNGAFSPPVHVEHGHGPIRARGLYVFQCSAPEMSKHPSTQPVVFEAFFIDVAR
jgi:hypothetical protein